MCKIEIYSFLSIYSGFLGSREDDWPFLAEMVEILDTLRTEISKFQTNTQHDSKPSKTTN